LTLRRLAEPRTSSYESIAAEYYNARRHPTCHNFNRLSRLFIAEHFTSEFSNKRVLEVGAGESSIAPLVELHGWNFQLLTISDNSPSMLRHSAKWRTKGARIIAGDAECLTEWGGQTDLIVAGLGDPYNTPKFWRGARDCLQVNGSVIFTLPSFEWAARFREVDAERSIARFVIETGEHVDVPSLVPTLEDLFSMIEGAGLTAVRFEALGVDKLGTDPISSKIGDASAYHSIVWGVVAKKTLDTVPLERRRAWHASEWDA
jgi:hypothetical protein